MARRYGGHPAVVAWQTDNEYGCHDTTLSYSPAALAAFRRWLRARYETVERMNEAWGTAFWGLQFLSFEQVGFPVGHASAQQVWHGLRSRPTWRVLCYSAEEPPDRRGLVLVDAVDGRVLEHLVESNPERWGTEGTRSAPGSGE